MAELTQSASGKHSNGKVRAKKLSLKLDMTPMVDLAFLLLTFFILTTTLSHPYIMDVTMPEGEAQPVNEKNILNVVLAAGDKVYWWEGLTGQVQHTNYSAAGIRKVVLDKKADNPHLMVIIKPSDESKYANLVDILDEMEITHTQRFAIVEFTQDDKLKIASRTP
jgi:biopolymer transport protein ExbD